LEKTMTRTTLTACAILLPLCAAASDEPAPAVAEAGDESAWWGSAHYTGVARWMLEQPDVEMRAAGLAFLSGGDLTERRIAPARYMAEVESILDSEPTGAAVYMIAQGCRQLDLLEACSEAGVPEAVDRFDRGNPLAASLFHDSESPEFGQVLISAERIDDHYPEFVSAWFEALAARKVDEAREGTELVAAISIAQAIAIPAMHPIVERCRSAVGSDEALDRACQRLSAQMRTSGRTSFLRSMGFGLARARADEVGDQALAQQYEKAGSAQGHPATCLSESAEEALGTDIDVQRRFLTEMRADGELAAFEELIEGYGSRCEKGAGRP
jgi:hypothetical protein